MAASLQLEEAEPEGDSTEIHSSSPPRLIHSHHQHLADYVKSFMEEREELTLGEDQAAPLVTEVPLYTPIWSIFQFLLISFHLSFSGYKDTMILLYHLQALQKICLASHIRYMADLLQADAVQQLEVALLGSLAAQVVDLLSGGNNTSSGFNICSTCSTPP